MSKTATLKKHFTLEDLEYIKSYLKDLRYKLLETVDDVEVIMDHLYVLKMEATSQLPSGKAKPHDQVMAEINAAEAKKKRRKKSLRVGK